MSPSPPTRPLYIDADPDPVFGVWHPAPTASARGTAVLICPPFGWEEICSYRSRRDWAAQLARSGHPALRIDLPGTGDSGGSPSDPARLEAWTAAVGATAGWLRAASGCERVAAIGIGLGGVAVWSALVDGASIDDLVLWAVPARGRTLVRELRAFAHLNAASVDPADAAEPSQRGESPASAELDDGVLETAGFTLSAQTSGALESLDLTARSIAGTSTHRVLLLERDGIAVDARLRRHLEELGAGVTVAPGPGYGTMMAHPQHARAPLEVFETVTAWLAAAAPPAASPAGTNGGAREEIELTVDGVRIRETPLVVERPFGRLACVLSEPLDQPDMPLSAVLFNAGAIRRIGPGRMWVDLARRWAARGVPALRVDLEGIGDSDGDASRYEDTAALYGQELVEQARAVLDELPLRGLSSRVVLVGLCSGGYWSFHAALSDERVAAAFLLNVRTLFWDDLLDAVREAPKLGQLVRRTLWRRALRGEVRLERVRLRARGALLTLVRLPGRRRRRRRLDSALDRLCETDKRTLFVFGGNEPLHEELERDGRLERMDRWPNLEFEVVPGRDHTFGPISSQRHVHEVLGRALDRELKRAGATGARPTSAPSPEVASG